MNKYVIDANIIFGAIISSRFFYLDLLKNLDLYAPDFVLKEIEKYEERILKKTKLEKKELNSFIIKFFRGITILPSMLMEKESKQRAMELCKDIDEKDAPYVALAIELDIPLITNDKKLIKGLREKCFFDVLLLEDIIQEIQK